MLKVAITKTMNQFQLNTEFEVAGGITGIIGPSGCGKSVTLQCLAGLQTPDNGEILVNGRPFYQSKNHINIKTQERNIGYVFQNYALFPHLTVRKNIEYGLNKISEVEKQQKVKNIIEKVQLTGYENRYPHQLSGGQQQRVALARTLVTEPSLLLLDEPFSALDHHVKHVLEQELLNIIKENYSGVVLLVTHNMEEAYRLCDRLILYNNGHIVQVGDKEDVFKSPKNISAAKIIGCKNIIPIEMIQETSNVIKCMVQGVTLTVKEQLITNNMDYMGIYPEDVTFIKAEKQSENSFRYKIIDLVKGIHQTTIAMEVENSFTIHAAISNNQLDSVLNEELKVELAPNKLFLMENDR